MSTFTLGPQWIDQYLSAIVLVNALLGYPDANQPLRRSSPESLLELLQEIARGVYRPEQHFGSGVRAVTGFVTKPPNLAAGESYLLIVVNASTMTTDFISVETGGIVFEDPAWALFAAVGILRGPDLGVPLAGDAAELWSRLSDLNATVGARKYTPGRFFAPVTGFVPPTSPPTFRLIEVTAERLNALRDRGVQSFGSPLRVYQLFERPTVQR